MAEETKTETSPAKAEENKELGNNMIPKTRFDEVIAQKNELNETLKGLVDELKSDIPDDFQDLVPETKPADQIKWIRAAIKKGIFTKKAETSPNPETPNSKQKPVDTSRMSAFDMLVNGFKNNNK